MTGVHSHARVWHRGQGLAPEMNINRRPARPPRKIRSQTGSKAGWGPVQSLDGRTWENHDGGDYGPVRNDTFMQQARYEIALHDAEMYVPVSKVPGVAEESLSQARGARRERMQEGKPGMRYSNVAGCFEIWAIVITSVEYSTDSADVRTIDLL